MTKEQKRLRLNGGILVATGIALALTVWAPFYPVAKLFLSVAHWPFFSAPDVAEPTARLLLAISGGLTAGIGAMMWAIGTEVMPVAPVAGRRVVMMTALAWFATDSLFSVLAGSPFNVVLNVAFLAMMLGALNLRGTQQTA